MQDPLENRPKTPDGSTLDAETLEFAQRIFELVRAGDAATLAPLLERGLPANLRNQKGDSLLMLASDHGHIELSRLLLAHEGDPELRNDAGQAPIASAASKGNPDMVRLLLDHGANVEGASPDGKTALMIAAMFNRIEVLKLLLDRGANPTARDDKGMTALDGAREMGAQDTAEHLAGLA